MLNIFRRGSFTTSFVMLTDVPFTSNSSTSGEVLKADWSMSTSANVNEYWVAGLRVVFAK
jgi:hypothetical protein